MNHATFFFFFFAYNLFILPTDRKVKTRVFSVTNRLFVIWPLITSFLLGTLLLDLCISATFFQFLRGFSFSLPPGSLNMLFQLP